MRYRAGLKRRKGAAAVEMALVTPFLLTMLFGIIEYGWIFTVRQSLIQAAREGARVAILPGTEDEEIVARVNQFLAPLGITSHSINMTRATDADPTETVSVVVPYGDVTLIGEYFGSTDRDLGATCSMRKEGL
ncbi:MAG: TadE/TadG family type IV pilus assembly protein [Phycisphaerae bacterium]